MKMAIFPITIRLIQHPEDGIVATILDALKTKEEVNKFLASVDVHHIFQTQSDVSGHAAAIVILTIMYDDRSPVRAYDG